MLCQDGHLHSKQLLPMGFAFVEKDHFESMARGAGFRVLELYGNYDRSPFDAIRSPVMIWVLEKGDAQPSVAADAPLNARLGLTVNKFLDSPGKAS